MHITGEELAQAQRWAAERLTAGDPPFSFRYDGRASAELLTQWPCESVTRELDASRTEQTLLWTDPASGLLVRCVAVTYRDFPAVEWTVYLRNTGAAATPIIEDLQGVDTAWQREGDAEFLLHHHTGDQCTPEGYEPHRLQLRPGMTQRFAPDGGRPCDGAFPYFHLQTPGEGGVFLAVGWPGQWAATFARDTDSGLRLRAGQERVHCRLQPGEEIRTPLIALLCYQGDDTLRAQNVWRRWMIAHNMPRPGGALPPPNLMATSSLQFNEMQDATEENQRWFLQRYLEKGMALDYWWMDAGWYPLTNSWYNTGTWEVDTRRFPHGLRAVSDDAHARGVQVVLWFEPERVTAGSWLDTEHPEWLLPADNPYNRLLNLGNPEALHWLIEHIDALLVAQGIDLYRQDFNFAPLTFWQSNDAADRQGITENHHITGYLAYWDELRRRHPALLLDSCASGGRRNDLETLRRAVPLHKTDYNYADLPVKHAFHHSLFSWLPYFGSPTLPIDTVDTYAFRSAMCLTSVIGFDVRRDDLDYALLKTLTEQWRRIAPFYYGDYYPLTPYQRGEEYWIAWQFHRPEQEDGIVQAFRRATSPYESARFLLHDLEPDATYRISDMDGGENLEMSGATLMERGLPVRAEELPQAMIFCYQRV
ncbi:MAG TPA: alpha-galactosidase [Armatimonadota bacterium]|jgi:alpha-galactosidase